MADDIVSERRTLDLGRAVHEAGEIIGHLPGANRAVQALQDQIRRFGPAQVAQHHFAGEHDRAGVHHVLVRVFGRGAVRGLENRVARDVVDVAARRDADAAHLRGQRVAEVIAVQVQRGDDIEIQNDANCFAMAEALLGAARWEI